MDLIVANLDKHFKNLKKNGATTAERKDLYDLEKEETPPPEPKENWSAIKFTHSPFGSVRQVRKTASGIAYGQPTFFSPVYTPINWQIPSRRREQYMWNRYWFENEPRVATCIDFLSRFPVTGFETECSNRYVKHFFDNLNKKLNLDKWLRIISHEVHLLGDCFPFLEIECDRCGGSGRVDGEICEHPGGNFKRLIIMNPDFIEVFTNPIAPDEVITYVPDDELRDAVIKTGPGTQKLSNEVKKMIGEGRPIPLDNLCVSHLKYGESGYKRYGISIIRRLFPILSYKTKIMTAQWIVAERMILPIKVVKVGTEERPASDADIAAVQNQLLASSNDPNVCIVTHHAFELEWYGACIPLTSDTEVLTEHGWKLYSDVAKDFSEKIAVYDSKSKEMRFENPLEYHEYDYNGEIINFSNDRIDFCATPNHRMLTISNYNGNKEFVVKFAKDIKYQTNFLSTVSWKGVIPESLPYKFIEKLNHLSLDEFLKFAGYYLSEGGLKIDCGIINAVHITQSTNNDCFEKIKSCVYKISSVIQESKDNRKNYPIVQFYINDSKFAREICSMLGKNSLEKKIPDWILNLSVDKLKIIFDAMMDGDGSTRNVNGYTRYRYSTVSKQLADNVCEILLKLGYDPIVSIEKPKKSTNSIIYRIYFTELCKKRGYKIVRKDDISKTYYNGKVWCFTTSTGFFITRRNGKIGIHGNSGKILAVQGEYEFINQEIMDGFGLNKQLITGEGQAYSSAGMGAEIMIRRLESWRLELKRWVEERIYRPVAKMMGFIEKNEWGEEEYIYPKLKWDSLNLRDRQNERQMILSLYDKGLISAKRVLDEFEIDSDTEFEQMRFERIDAMAQQPPGQAGPGGGAPGGGMGDLGGMGGGLSIGGAGAPPGGEAGAPPGGAPPGGMPGGEAGGVPMGGPGGAPPTANTSQVIKTAQVSPVINEPAADPMMFGGKILTPETRDKLEREKEKYLKKKHKHDREHVVPGSPQDQSGFARDTRGRIMMTSIEREVMKGIEQYQRTGQIKYSAVPSHEVFLGSRPIMIDIAFPDLKLAIECDGFTFHGSPEQQEKDEIRDKKLNNLGWIVVRFWEEDIKKDLGSVMKKIVSELDKRELWLKEQRKSLEEKRKEDKLGQ